MSIELREDADGRILNVKASGKLTKTDYALWIPESERLIQQHGKIRIVFEMHEFHGWEAGTLWEDMKFEWKHFRDIERVAMVGEKAWQHGMAMFCKPFTSAAIQYFDQNQFHDAQNWIEEGMNTRV